MSATPIRSALSAPERVLVLGGSPQTLDLLRLAVIRSDDVTAMVPRPDDRVRRFAAQFAVELLARDPVPADFDDAAVVLIGIGDIETDNRWLREARRHRVPVHVADRPLVSDFSLLDLVEGRSLARWAA